jgi:hypothetical protein
MKTFYELAVEASGLVIALGYENEPEFKNLKSSGEFCRGFRDFLIDNRDSEGFRVRVEHADCLPALLRWTLDLQRALKGAS